MWQPQRPEARPALVMPAVLLLAAGLLAYANAFRGGFQFDDWNVIVQDPRVQSLAAWRESMPGIRPLLKLSYALNHASGLGLAGFHALNLGIHLANGLLLLALLRRWGGSLPGSNVVAATVAALLFVLHPVQTEAVTYLSGRSTSLAALFGLSSLLAWVEGRRQQRAWLAQALSPLLFACALATRETAAVLPLALLLWRATAEGGGLASGLRATAVHWGVLLLAAAAAWMLPEYRHFFATSLEARPLAAQLASQVNAVGWLAGQLLRVDRLNADPMLPVPAGATPGLVIAGLVLAMVLLCGLFSLRRRPVLAFGLLWFFLWLAPTNSLLPRLDVANDRQLYLALAGPAWLAGVAVAWLWSRRRAAALLATAVVATGLLLATVARNRIYESETIFWTDVVAKTPGNSRAWNNLGHALALAGKPAAAERALRAALAVDPGNYRAAMNLALLRAGALGPAMPGEPHNF